MPNLFPTRCYYFDDTWEARSLTVAAPKEARTRLQSRDRKGAGLHTDHDPDGRMIVKHDPFPGALISSILPPWCVTI